MLRLIQLSLLVELDEPALEYYTQNHGDLIEAITNDENTLIHILEVNDPRDFTFGLQPTPNDNEHNNNNPF